MSTFKWASAWSDRVNLTETTVSCLHYATHDKRVTHGHRKLRLAEDFEMLRLTPDFETLCLTCDIKTLRLMPAIRLPDTSQTHCFEIMPSYYKNHLKWLKSCVIFCDHVSDVQYESSNVLCTQASKRTIIHVIVIAQSHINLYII